MTLVNARAAFEKAITDSVTSADASVKLIYDNIPQTLPGKTITFIILVQFNVIFMFLKIKVLLCYLL